MNSQQRRKIARKAGFKTYLRRSDKGVIWRFVDALVLLELVDNWFISDALFVRSCMINTAKNR